MSEYLGFYPTQDKDYYFVSYNSDDSERLTGLVSRISSSGIPLWYDYGIEYDETDWIKQIGEKIDHCKGMILFISKNLFSKSDTFVKLEYDYAKNKHKQIYVVLMESIDYSSDVPFPMYPWWNDIGKRQCLEAWKYSDAVGVLKEVYRMLGKHIPDSKTLNTMDVSLPVTGKEIGLSNDKPSEIIASKYQACDILIKLENSYQSNPRHIFVFNELEQAYRDDTYRIRFTGMNISEDGISNADLVLYFTFFEGLYRVIKNGILTIEDIDDCFSDRFFKYLHNQYVQENELYIVPSTYVNIFELYTLWKKHHLINLSSPSRIISFLNNEIPDYYLDRRTYLQDVWDIGKRKALERRFQFVNLSRHSSSAGYTEFVMRRLFPRDLGKVVKLQNDVIEELEDDSLFVETTKQEYLESMLIDFCYGLFDNDSLVAVCIIVLNRETDRNLVYSLDNSNNESNQKQLSFVDAITFDTIQVKKNYRGFGIQKFFLSVAENLCSMLNAKCIIASVSPQNFHSKTNFVRFGYSVQTTKRLAKGVYHNKERNIMIKDVQQ